MRVREEGFRFALDDAGVATITLDRPDRINALTFASYGLSASGTDPVLVTFDLTK